MIDLGTVRKGDKLKLRCGGVIIAEEESTVHDGMFSFDEYSQKQWNRYGGWTFAEDPFDIIDIETAPEKKRTEFFDVLHDGKDTWFSHAYLCKKDCENVRTKYRIDIIEITYENGNITARSVK